jgi:hypothetical protein
MTVKSGPLRIRLTVDAGLATYLRALVASPAGIFGDEGDTIIYALRTFLIDKMTIKNGFREPIIRELPPDFRKRWPRP